MTAPLLHLTLTLKTEAGEVVREYRRDGPITERTQLLSWVRDCSCAFLEEMKENERTKV